MSDLAFRSLPSVASEIRSKSISATELLEANIKQIDKWGESNNVFTLTLLEEARERARQMDAESAKGIFRGPLHGITLAVKDLIDVSGYRNTAGTGSRKNAAPASSNADCVQRLVDAGANIVGLANLHEWAYGGTSSNPFFGPVRNMWDSNRMPGGSSGGSAVAVSGGMALMALGTDTGGSVRIPASVTGTSALKVTVGSLSTRGVMPLTWTLDTVGPMARRVEDLFAPYAALSGSDERTKANGYSTPGNKKIVLGIDRSYYLEEGRIEPGVYSVFLTALEQLKSAGVTIVDVSMPLLKNASPAQYALVLAEAAAVHSGKHRAERREYGADVQGYLALGDGLLAQDYIAAHRFRAELWNQMRSVFEGVDFLVSPSTPHVASPIGQGEFLWPNGTTESLLDACWRFTFPSNLVGIPSISQPCGLTPEGLPVGLQLIGRPNSEWDLLIAARNFEREMDWDFRPPSTIK